jgi:hypothetical protein
MCVSDTTYTMSLFWYYLKNMTEALLATVALQRMTRSSARTQRACAPSETETDFLDQSLAKNAKQAIVARE